MRSEEELLSILLESGDYIYSNIIDCIHGYEDDFMFRGYCCGVSKHGDLLADNKVVVSDVAHKIFRERKVVETVYALVEYVYNEECKEEFDLRDYI